MKICAIFNIFPAYRKNIYKKMDEQLPVDFIIGDISSENIALGNTKTLTNTQVIHNVYRGTKLVWQRKSIRLAFSKKYSHYIFTGNTGILSNWVILLICKLLGRKTILWSHSLYGNEKCLTKFKNRLYLKLADHIFTYNQRGTNLLINNGFKANRVTPIFNSIDVVEIDKTKNDCSFLRNYFGNDSQIISFTGRLTPQKKVEQLIKAMAISKSKFNLVIVGDGECRKVLEKLVESNNLLDRVWFYGECYDKTMVATIIANSTLTVSPGNCGLNAIESLSYGTPMITHSNLCNQMPESEAVVELCQRANINLLFEENSIDSLAKTIDDNINIDKNNIEQLAKLIIAEKWNASYQIQTMVHYLTK